jgi:hypothetical protein
MPSIEYIQGSNGERKVSLAINDLRVFLLFTCPACDAYTIHKPRLSIGNHWYVDHRLEPVHQLDFNGNEFLVGLAPAESCFVDNNRAIEEIRMTRTVIRVK